MASLKRQGSPTEEEKEEFSPRIKIIKGSPRIKIIHGSPREETSLLSPESTIIITIGRMNPPTPGHLLLIKTLIISAAQENLSKVYIILSHTQDEKNPIHCWEKRDLYLEWAISRMKDALGAAQQDADFGNKIRNIDVVIICMDDPEVTNGGPIMGPINYILSLYPPQPITLKLFIGDDRQEGETSKGFSFIGNILSRKTPKVTFEEVVLKRDEMEDKKEEYRYGTITDLSTVSPESMSASLVRLVVEKRDKTNFDVIYKDKMYLSPEELDQLYISLTTEIPEEVSGGKKTKQTKKRKKNKKTQKRKNRKNKKTEKRKKRKKRSKRTKM